MYLFRLPRAGVPLGRGELRPDPPLQLQLQPPHPSLTGMYRVKLQLQLQTPHPYLTGMYTVKLQLQPPTPHPYLTGMYTV